MTPARRLVITAAVAVVATLLFSWATWALFLAPRSAGDTAEAFVLAMAQKVREGDLDDVREHLDPQFTFEPLGLDRDAAIAVARNELAAGRFFPYVAMTHPIPGGVDDVELVAAIGVLAQGDPEKNRYVNLVPIRVELKLRKTSGGFVVLSARKQLGR